MRHSLRHRARWALLAVVLLHAPLLAARAGGETRNVLVLSSTERPFSPQSGFAETLVRDLIQSSREPIQFVEVPIQPARATSRSPDAAITQRIHSAFGAEPLHLVLTIGGAAATFAQQFRQELFPSTPMLIAGVDRRFVENGKFGSNETTVATEHDPALMIDEILRLLPETRTVMVVVGASQVEQFWLQEMKREFRRFDGRLQFTWTNELSFAEIVERCRTMPAQSAILYAILSLDGAGEPQVGDDTVASLHAVANVPMFGLYKLGSGIVGGPLLSADELSQTTAQVALRLLAGEPPGSIKTPVQRTGRPTYDGRELRRWNIDEGRLPPGSVVQFRTPTIWQQYRRPIAIGALLGAIPVVAIVLLVGVIKRRHGRLRGHFRGRAPATNAGVVPGPVDAAVSVWITGADGQRVGTGDDPGAAPPPSWIALVHPGDAERCREIYRRALEKHEPFQMEYRVREADGGERWILDTGLPRFSGEHFDGYVGSAVDITSLGRAQAELSQLSGHLLKAHEQERAALARTLHEDVCQRMAALTLRLHNLPDATPDGEVTEIKEALAGLVSELTAVSDPIYQRLELLGLAGAARSFCHDLAAGAGVAIQFQDDGIPRDLAADIALALFRVLQEAAVNAVVHSGAREVSVSIRGTAEEIHLQTVDRGLGFDTHRIVPGGIGLVAIRERLKLVNGRTVIQSRPGEGTRVDVWVPL